MEDNTFLKKAMSLAMAKVEVDGSKGAKEDTGVKQEPKAKKFCTTFEKFVKKQTGDVSYLSDS